MRGLWYHPLPAECHTARNTLRAAGLQAAGESRARILALLISTRMLVENNTKQRCCKCSKVPLCLFPTLTRPFGQAQDFKQVWKSQETNKRDKRQRDSEEHSGGHITSTAQQLLAGRSILPLSSSQMDHPENLGAIRKENKQMRGKKGGGRRGRRARRDSLHHLHASVARMKWSYMEEECRWKSLQWECNKIKGYENTQGMNELQHGH